MGAVVLSPEGAVLAEAANAREAEHDPTAHAEIRALRAAGAALGDSHLDGCTLVVTLEPCTMCAGAIVLARVARLVLGAWEPGPGPAARCATSCVTPAPTTRSRCAPACAPSSPRTF